MASSKNIRILIADHDRGFAEAARRYLESRGHEVVVVTDGLSCVEEIRAISPTLLVLDPEILWGGGEGVLDFLIREVPISPLTVVIVERQTTRTIPESFNSRIDCRVQRPVALNEMSQFVRQLEDYGLKSKLSTRELETKSRVVAASSN